MEGFLRSVPKLTLVLLTTSVLISALASYNLVPIYKLSFSSRIWTHSQYWRLLTSFTFHGTFSLGTFIHFLLYFNSSRQMELQGSGQYLYYTTMVYIISLLSGIFVGVIWMSDAHFLAIVYVNCRRNRDSKIAIMGLPIQISAAYLPYITLALNFSTGSIIGICLGHIYYYFEDIYPKLPNSRNKRYLNAPMIFLRFSEILRL